MQSMTPASLTGPDLPHPSQISSTTTLTSTPNNGEHIPSMLTSTPINEEHTLSTPAIGAGHEEVEMTTIRTGANVTPSQCEALTTPTNKPALHKRAAAYFRGALAEEHNFGLKIAGVCFAFAMFVLELWGRIDSLVQDN